MSEAAKAERWQDNRRIDGVQIVERIERPDTYAIVMPSGMSMIACPCCDLPFRAPRQARLVADIIYPITRDN